MTGSGLPPAAPSVPVRRLPKTHFFGDHVSHMHHFPGYAGSGWWAGVPHEGAGVK